MAAGYDDEVDPRCDRYKLLSLYASGKAKAYYPEKTEDRDTWDRLAFKQRSRKKAYRRDNTKMGGEMRRT